MVLGGSQLTGANALDQAYTRWRFTGTNYSLDLNGQDVTYSSFEGANLEGTAVSTVPAPIIINRCRFADVSLPPFSAQQCSVGGTITATGLGVYTLDHSSSGVAGGSSPLFYFAANAELNLRHYSGGMEIHSMASTNKMSMEGNGQLKIAADCANA